MTIKVVEAVSDSLIDSVRENLSDDLLKPQFRGQPFPVGHCYVAAEAIYHMLGGKESGLKPVHLKMPDGVVHWWLETPDGEVIDPTHDQYDDPIPYEEGRGGGFLTKEPSRRAQELMRRVQSKTASAWWEYSWMYFPSKGFIIGSAQVNHRKLMQENGVTSKDLYDEPFVMGRIFLDKDQNIAEIDVDSDMLSMLEPELADQNQNDLFSASTIRAVNYAKQWIKDNLPGYEIEYYGEKMAATKEARTTMYHASPSRYRDSILKNGLQNISQYHPLGNEDPRDTNEENFTAVGVVFLMDTPQMAEAFVRTYKGAGEYDVWAVDVSGITLSRDYIMYAHAPVRPFFTMVPIPPDRLHLLYTFHNEGGESLGRGTPLDLTKGYEDWRGENLGEHEFQFGISDYQKNYRPYKGENPLKGYERQRQSSHWKTTKIVTLPDTFAPHPHDDESRRTFVYIKPLDTLFIAQNNAYHQDIFEYLYKTYPEEYATLFYPGSNRMDNSKLALGFIERNYEDHALEARNYWDEGEKIPDHIIFELEEYFGEPIYQRDWEYPQAPDPFDRYDPYYEEPEIPTEQWPLGWNSEEGIWPSSKTSKDWGEWDHDDGAPFMVLGKSVWVGEFGGIHADAPPEYRAVLRQRKDLNPLWNTNPDLDIWVGRCFPDGTIVDWMDNDVPDDIARLVRGEMHREGLLTHSKVSALRDVKWIADQLGGTVEQGEMDEIAGKRVAPYLIMPDGTRVQIGVTISPAYRRGRTTIVLWWIESVPRGTGAGTKVMNALKQLADEKGYDLQIHLVAGAARPFYEKFDWLDNEAWDGPHYRQSALQKLGFDRAFIYTQDGHLFVEDKPHPQILREHNINLTEPYVTGFLKDTPTGDGPLWITFFSWSQEDESELHEDAALAIDREFGKMPTEVSYDEMVKIDQEIGQFRHRERKGKRSGWNLIGSDLPYAEDFIEPGTYDVYAPNVYKFAWLPMTNQVRIWADSEYSLGDNEGFMPHVNVLRDLLGWDKDAYWRDLYPNLKSAMSDVVIGTIQYHTNGYEENASSIRVIIFSWESYFEGSNESSPNIDTNKLLAALKLPPTTVVVNDEDLYGKFSSAYAYIEFRGKVYEGLSHADVLGEITQDTGASLDEIYDEGRFGALERGKVQWYDKFSGTQPVEVMIGTRGTMAFDHFYNQLSHNTLAWCYQDGTLYIGPYHKDIIKEMRQEGFDPLVNSLFGWIWAGNLEIATDFGVQDESLVPEVNAFFEKYPPKAVLNYALTGRLAKVAMDEPEIIVDESVGDDGPIEEKTRFVYVYSSEQNRLVIAGTNRMHASLIKEYLLPDQPEPDDRRYGDLVAGYGSLYSGWTTVSGYALGDWVSEQMDKWVEQQIHEMKTNSIFESKISTKLEIVPSNKHTHGLGLPFIYVPEHDTIYLGTKQTGHVRLIGDSLDLKSFIHPGEYGSRSAGIIAGRVDAKGDIEFYDVGGEPTPEEKQTVMQTLKANWSQIMQLEIVDPDTPWFDSVNYVDYNDDGDYLNIHNARVEIVENEAIGFGGNDADDRHPVIYDPSDDVVYVGTAGSSTHAELLRAIPKFKKLIESSDAGIGYLRQAPFKDFGYYGLYYSYPEGYSLTHYVGADMPQENANELLNMQRGRWAKKSNDDPMEGYIDVNKRELQGAIPVIIDPEGREYVGKPNETHSMLAKEHGLDFFNDVAKAGIRYPDGREWWMDWSTTSKTASMMSNEPWNDPTWLKQLQDKIDEYGFYGDHVEIYAPHIPFLVLEDGRTWIGWDAMSHAYDWMVEDAEEELNINYYEMGESQGSINFVGNEYQVHWPSHGQHKELEPQIVAQVVANEEKQRKHYWDKGGGIYGKTAATNQEDHIWVKMPDGQEISGPIEMRHDELLKSLDAFKHMPWNQIVRRAIDEGYELGYTHNGRAIPLTSIKPTGKTSPYQTSWIYDPETDELYTGLMHTSIMRRYDIDANRDLVFGWITDGRPEIVDQFDPDNPTEDERRALNKVWDSLTDMSKHTAAMNVWLDDERPAPEGWQSVRSYDEAIALLDSGQVDKISLDNDLGMNEEGTAWDDSASTGEDVLRYIMENKLPVKVEIHTSNPLADERMRSLLDDRNSKTAAELAEIVGRWVYDRRTDKLFVGMRPKVNSHSELFRQLGNLDSLDWSDADFASIEAGDIWSDGTVESMGREIDPQLERRILNEAHVEHTAAMNESYHYEDFYGGTDVYLDGQEVATADYNVVDDVAVIHMIHINPGQSGLLWDLLAHIKEVTATSQVRFDYVINPRLKKIIERGRWANYQERISLIDTTQRNTHKIAKPQTIYRGIIVSSLDKMRLNDQGWWTTYFNTAAEYTTASWNKKRRGIPVVLEATVESKDLEIYPGQDEVQLWGDEPLTLVAVYAFNDGEWIEQPYDGKFTWTSVEGNTHRMYTQFYINSSPRPSTTVQPGLQPRLASDERAWVYDPATGNIYRGNTHAEIIREHHLPNNGAFAYGAIDRGVDYIHWNYTGIPDAEILATVLPLLNRTPIASIGAYPHQTSLLGYPRGAKGEHLFPNEAISRVEVILPWVESFVEERGYADLAEPKNAFARCKEISFELAEYLRENGIEVNILNLNGYLPSWETMDRRWYSLKDFAIHYAVLAGNYVIDLTARQFDPSFPFPMVMPKDEYMSIWANAYDAESLTKPEIWRPNEAIFKVADILPVKEVDNPHVDYALDPPVLEYDGVLYIGTRGGGHHQLAEAASIPWDKESMPKIKTYAWIHDGIFNWYNISDDAYDTLISLGYKPLQEKVGLLLTESGLAEGQMTIDGTRVHWFDDGSDDHHAIFYMKESHIKQAEGGDIPVEPVTIDDDPPNPKWPMIWIYSKDGVIYVTGSNQFHRKLLREIGQDFTMVHKAGYWYPDQVGKAISWEQKFVPEVQKAIEHWAGQMSVSGKKLVSEMRNINGVTVHGEFDRNFEEARTELATSQAAIYQDGNLYIGTEGRTHPAIMIQYSLNRDDAMLPLWVDYKRGIINLYSYEEPVYRELIPEVLPVLKALLPDMPIYESQPWGAPDESMRVAMEPQKMSAPTLITVEVEPTDFMHDAWIYDEETDIVYYAANAHHLQLFNWVKTLPPEEQPQNMVAIGDVQFYYDNGGTIEIDTYEGSIPDIVKEFLENIYQSNHESDIEEEMKIYGAIESHFESSVPPAVEAFIDEGESISFAYQYGELIWGIKEHPDGYIDLLTHPEMIYEGLVDRNKPAAYGWIEGIMGFQPPEIHIMSYEERVAPELVQAAADAVHAATGLSVKDINGAHLAAQEPTVQRVYTPNRSFAEPTYPWIYVPEDNTIYVGNISGAHPDLMKAIGKNWSREDLLWSNLFAGEVYPNGAVSVLYGSDDVDMERQVRDWVSRLVPRTLESHVGAVEDWDIIHLHTDSEPDYSPDWKNGRRPVLYLPDTKQIFIGDPGHHHRTLATKMKEKGYDWRNPNIDWGFTVPNWGTKVYPLYNPNADEVQKAVEQWMQGLESHTAAGGWHVEELPPKDTDPEQETAFYDRRLAYIADGDTKTIYVGLNWLHRDMFQYVNTQGEHATELQRKNRNLAGGVYDWLGSGMIDSFYKGKDWSDEEDKLVATTLQEWLMDKESHTASSDGFLTVDGIKVYWFDDASDDHHAIFFDANSRTCYIGFNGHHRDVWGHFDIDNSHTIDAYEVDINGQVERLDWFAGSPTPEDLNKDYTPEVQVAFDAAVQQYLELKSHKEAMALTPETVEEIAPRIPYLYHMTSHGRLKGIQQNGLVPWNQQEEGMGGTDYDADSFWRPRSDHIYLTDRYGLKKVEEFAGGGLVNFIFRVKLTSLDPSKINADEDFLYNLYYQRQLPRRFKNSPGRGNYPQPLPDKWDWEFSNDEYKERFPDEMREWIEMHPGMKNVYSPPGLGEWADAIQPDEPEITQDSLLRNHTVAYNGVIPPELLEYNTGTRWVPATQMLQYISSADLNIVEVPTSGMHPFGDEPFIYVAPIDTIYVADKNGRHHEIIRWIKAYDPEVFSQYIQVPQPGTLVFGEFVPGENRDHISSIDFFDENANVISKYEMQRRYPDLLQWATDKREEMTGYSKMAAKIVEVPTEPGWGGRDMRGSQKDIRALLFNPETDTIYVGGYESFHGQLIEAITGQRDNPEYRRNWNKSYTMGIYERGGELTWWDWQGENPTPTPEENEQLIRVLVYKDALESHTAATEVQWVMTHDDSHGQGLPWIFVDLGEDQIIYIGTSEAYHHTMWGDIVDTNVNDDDFEMGRVSPEGVVIYGWSIDAAKRYPEEADSMTPRGRHLCKIIWQAYQERFKTATKVVQIPEVGEDHVYEPTSRQPFIYSPTTDTVYIGPYGAHHHQLIFGAFSLDNATPEDWGTEEYSAKEMIAMTIEDDPGNLGVIIPEKDLIIYWGEPQHELEEQMKLLYPKYTQGVLDWDDPLYEPVLSKTATRIIEVEPQPDDERIIGDERRPFVWDSAMDTIYVGKPGTYHKTIFNELGEGKLHAVEIKQPGMFIADRYGVGAIQRSGITWWSGLGKPPSDEAIRALENYTQQPTKINDMV